ncbi:Ku protein [Roseateles violae]|uniref:Non-homologous end joining protein Ku n=1 Tax=Roseateles violae TaxID=3058042 RepID=A0ABT8DLR7_9BURK|nr:Ku protein [Pelomonas sp. PFR6]MDN3919361.1 Ku protein [Pelomonas sp. PFR6]
MARIIWKGAISFGLVHVPVALYPATREDDIDFDWLDKRSMDPVGYQRINKRTGRAIKKEDIVKGVKQDDGDYVLISDEEIKAAYPQTTQTIEIEAFVTAAEIPFLFLERPFYLEPLGKAAKVYALLREAMLADGSIGIARVVMHNKQHLAALIPSGPALLLNTLRWPDEIRPWDELKFPAEGKSAAGIKDAELKMARQLIEEMKTQWQADDYHDEFKAAIGTLIAAKAEAGQTKRVTPLEATPGEESGSNVVDLTDLLKRSLAAGKSGSGGAGGSKRKKA